MSAPAPPATVIFDRDGTLLDFYEMFHQFILRLHQLAGLVPPSREAILAYSYWESILSGDLHIGQTRVRDRIDEVPTRHMALGKLYPGVAQALRTLATRGVEVVVISGWVGTEATSELLRRHQVRDACVVVSTRDDLPARHRDDPDVQCKHLLATRALAKLRRPSRLVVVGDSPSDVELGRRLGAWTVGVRTGNGHLLPGPGEPHGPDILVASAADVVPLLGDPGWPAAT